MTATDTSKRIPIAGPGRLVFSSHEGCAYGAMRAANRASAIADECLELSVRLGVMHPMVIAAVYAAFSARKAAQAAELAADYPDRYSLKQALSNLKQAVRQEYRAALAKRRLLEQLPDLGRTLEATCEIDLSDSCEGVESDIVVGNETPHTLKRRVSRYASDESAKERFDA